MADVMMKRRDILWGGAASLLAAGSARAASPAPRLAAIDWAMLETAVALGVMPAAATELLQYRKWAREPEIPSDVLDLGLRGSPNFERLHLMRPDLILISPFYNQQVPMLEAIAPIFSLPFYIPGEPPFAKALAAVTALGDKLGRPSVATDVHASALAEIEERRGRLAAYAKRPTYLVNIGDPRHFRAFGADSMFGDMLARLGLPNAWRDMSRFTYAAPVPLESLGEDPEARIVIVSHVPVEARSGLHNSMIWNALKPVREGRVLQLDNVNAYGGILAGLRFARLLEEGLTAREGLL